MNMSTWCIRNPIPALMLFVILCFTGLMSFKSMKVQNMPDLDLPTISVSASLPGASPSQLETEVAQKIENSIATISNLKHITTKIQDGSVAITAEFQLEKPGQEALDDVRSAVAKVPEMDAKRLAAAAKSFAKVATRKFVEEALASAH